MEAHGERARELLSSSGRTTVRAAVLCRPPAPSGQYRPPPLRGRCSMFKVLTGEKKRRAISPATLTASVATHLLLLVGLVYASTGPSEPMEVVGTIVELPEMVEEPKTPPHAHVDEPPAPPAPTAETVATPATDT